MQGLQAETGVDPGWINNGGLFIASTKERLDEYKRLMSVPCRALYSQPTQSLEGADTQHGKGTSSRS